MKYAFAAIRCHRTERRAALLGGQIQILRRRIAFGASARCSKHENWHAQASRTISQLGARTRAPLQFPAAGHTLQTTVLCRGGPSYASLSPC